MNNLLFTKNKIASVCGSILLLISCNVFAAYDAFPASEGPYVSGPASSTLPFSGDDFEIYGLSSLLECSSDKTPIEHFDVTSGCLYVEEERSWQRGFTSDSVYRMVAIGRDANDKEIKWTDQVPEYMGYVEQWHNGGEIPNWSGLHVFARYRTSDDLYAASIRYDGQVTIKRKWAGVYTTLAVGQLDNEFREYLDGDGKLNIGKWYRLKFSAIGNQLTFYVDGKPVLSAQDGTFSWGTTGIRIDNADAYVDNWKLVY